MSTIMNYTNTIHLTIDNDGKYESITLLDKMYEKMITIPVELAKNVMNIMNITVVNFVADYDDCYLEIDKEGDKVKITNLHDSTVIELLYSEYKFDFDHLLQIL